MKNKDKLEVPKPTWNDCQTGREEQSKILTSLLMNRYNYLNSEEKAKAEVVNTFSLNINASWGKGKTFFIQRWAKDLRTKGHIVLEFNAWEHDYSKDALTCLLSSLYTQLKQALAELDGRSASRKQLERVGIGMKNVVRRGAPAILNGALKTYLGVSIPSDKLGEDFVGALAESIGKLGEETVNELFENKEGYDQAIRDFKVEMSSLVEKVEEEKSGKFKAPIFVFIDDLDRCRPNFSIELIECVKHVLGVSGYYFIFASDAEQLQNSISAVYGDKINGERYFKRVFNRECNLKEPDHDQFAKFIFSKNEFNSEDLILENLIFPKDYKSIEEGLSVWFSLLSQAFDLDLRLQLACRDQIDDLLNIRKNEKTIVFVLMHLVILWNMKKDAAEKQITKGANNGQDLVVNGVEFVVMKYDVDMGSKPVGLSMQNIIRTHYEISNKKNSELKRSLEMCDNSLSRYIFDRAIMLTRGQFYNHEEVMINYEKMFEQIKLTS